MRSPSRSNSRLWMQCTSPFQTIPSILLSRNLCWCLLRTRKPLKSVIAFSSRVGRRFLLKICDTTPAVWFYRKAFLKYSGKLHYFSLRDVETVSAEFEGLEHCEFHLSAVSALFWQKCISIPLFYRWTLRILKAIDTFLLKCLPFLKRFCWITAMICHKG